MTRREMIAAAGTIPLAAQTASIGRKGVGVTPAHFPRHDAEDVRLMFGKAREVGPVGVFIYQCGAPAVPRSSVCPG